MEQKKANETSKILKKTISNIDLFVLAKEIHTILEDGFINNVYEIDSDQKNLLLKCRSKIGKQKLIIDSKCRINLTQYDYPTPNFPSQFIMSLRKFLKGRRIKQIYQYHLDRIIVIELTSSEGEPWKFIVEFFGGGNFILVDGEDIVIIAQHYKKYRDRQILPKHVYSFPETRGVDIFNLQEDIFSSIIQENSGQIVRNLARNFNMGGYLAEEICLRANIDKKTKIKDLSSEDIHLLFDKTQEIMSSIVQDQTAPRIIKDSNESNISFEPIELKLLDDFPFLATSSFNEAVDLFFSSIDSEILFSGEVNESKSKLSKTEKILKQQLDKIEESKELREESLEHGHLIYQYMNEIDNLISTIMTKKREDNIEWDEIHKTLLKGKEMEIPECKIYDKLLPKEVKLQVDLDGHKFKLDLKKNAVENAELIYKKAKKAKKKIIGAAIAAEKTKEKIEKQKENHEFVESQKAILIKRPKQKWYEKYRWFISSDGFLIIGGRDASSNEKIYSAHMNNNDLFFHTDVRGASVCIIKNDEKKEIPLQTIKETGQFASSYSSAWKQGWGNADIYYVSPEQVSKTPKSGEYLKKGSFVINGKKNFLPKPFLEIAIGVKLIPINVESNEDLKNTDLIDEENESQKEEIQYFPKVLAAPESAFKDTDILYVKIRPNKGGKKVSDLAKEILKLLTFQANEEQKPWIQLTSLNDLIRAIPPGNADVIKN